MRTRSLCALAVGLALCGPARSSQTPEKAPQAKPKVAAYTTWPFDAAEAKRRQAETAKALGVAAEREVDLGGGVKLTLVLIPAGEFLMGSPESELRRVWNEAQHRVTISKPFWIGKYEVTQEQWRAVMRRNRSRFKDPKRPVEQASWNDIQLFLKALNARVPGGGFGLPTEAQWEYACRAGTATPFHVGETISTDQADFNGEAPYGTSPVGVHRKETVPVGSFPPNAWGHHDMHGNVWEWCQDWYAPYPKGAQTDPRGPDEGERRVLRGGGWLIVAAFARSACRAHVLPSNRYCVYGFRLASPAR